MNPLSLIGGASPLLGGLFKLADSLFTSEEERDQAKLKILELHTAGQLAQLEVNKVEAASNSMWVAGWRPYVGWVCGTAFAWQYVVQPVFTTLIVYVAGITGATVDLTGVPELPMTELLPVLMGMLGMGWLRSDEKKAGVADSNPRRSNK